MSDSDTDDDRPRVDLSLALANALEHTESTRRLRSLVAPSTDHPPLYLVTEVFGSPSSQRLEVMNTAGEYQNAATVHEYVNQEVTELCESVMERSRQEERMVAEGCCEITEDYRWEYGCPWDAKVVVGHHEGYGLATLLGCMSARFAKYVFDHSPCRTASRDLDALACTSTEPRIFVGNSRRVLPLWRIKQYITPPPEDLVQTVSRQQVLALMRRLAESYGHEDHDFLWEASINMGAEATVTFPELHPHELVERHLIENNCAECGVASTCYACMTKDCRYGLCVSCVEGQQEKEIRRGSIEVWHGEFFGKKIGVVWAASPFKGGPMHEWLEGSLLANDGSGYEWDMDEKELAQYQEERQKHLGPCVGIVANQQLEQVWPPGVDKADVVEVLGLCSGGCGCGTSSDLVNPEWRKKKKAAAPAPTKAASAKKPASKKVRTPARPNGHSHRRRAARRQEEGQGMPQALGEEEGLK